MPLDLSVSGKAKDTSLRSGRCGSSACTTPTNRRPLSRAGSSSSLTMLGMAALGQDASSTSQVSGRRSMSGTRMPAKSSSLTAAPPSARRASSTTSSSRPPSGKKAPVVDNFDPQEDLAQMRLHQDSSPLKADPAPVPSRASAYPRVAAKSQPGTVVRATEWTEAVENAYRLQFCDYRDLQEYESHWGPPEYWPADEQGNKFISKVQLKGSGHFTYWRKFRECEDKNVKKVKLYS